MTSKNRPDKKNKTYQGKSEEKNTETFPVIAIGSSAGGLEALKDFFAKVPADTGMAFVIVAHLSPEHPSMLPEILQKETNIPVSSAKDGETILQDHVYIIPSDKEMEIYQGKIQLLDKKIQKLSLPIDTFFHSLAKNYRSKAVGVILSGTGTDGTKGIREIKAYEGLILVQSENTTEYNGMPASAISTGVADLVLPPHEMPEMIVRYFNNPSSVITAEGIHYPSGKELKQEDGLNKIFSILTNQTNYDFTPYKTNTLQRRINRRMLLRQISTYKEYIDYLHRNPNEIEILFNELLIGVTSFFRDHESFDMLTKKGLSKTLEQVPGHSNFRVWVPGCSTGEEVYSLAIILYEYLDQTSKRVNLQLFGTDINKEAIEKARTGVYPASIAADVGEERLERFFTKEGDYYRIKEEIRETAIFSVQNVLKDPPFSRLNLLSCRNLLIYFDSETQKKLFPLFHYALSPNGILMLGSSESTGEFTQFFEPLDKKWKIFSKKEVPISLKNRIHFPSEPTFQENAEKPSHPPPKKPKQKNFVQITQNVILEQFSPSAVLVDSEGTILHIEGRVGKYLEQPSGPPSLNVLDQAREGLHIELSSAFRKAKEANKTIIRRGIAVKTNGDRQTIDLHVVPQNNEEATDNQYLIVFQENDQPVQSSDADASLKRKDNDDSSKVAELERELQLNRESYKTTVQELEASNEKLKTTNEELQSSNEELQSTNEELESSKEELQSLNEELRTLNSELQNKVEELSTARDDMYNLLDSREIATIFVDNDMCVRRFTLEATKIVNLIQSDLGRPLKHVVTNLTYERMIDDLCNVLKKLIAKEIEVQTKEGHWYSMRIIPYRTTDNRIDGAVLTFINIDEQKDYQEKLQKTLQEKQEAHDLVREVFDMNREALLVLDVEGNMLTANTAFFLLMGIEKQKIQGRKIDDFKKELQEQVNIREYLQNAVKKGENFKTNSFELNKPEGSVICTIYGRIILTRKQNVYRILLNFTEEKK